jgi:hypothetical protein
MKAMPLAAGVQTAGLYTLILLMVDPIVREQNLENSVLSEVALKAMRNHEWDASVQSHASMLVQQLPEKLLEEFVAGDGARYLVQSLESHGENDEVVINACGAMETLARHNSDPRSSLHRHFTLSFTSVDLPTAVLGILDGLARAESPKMSTVAPLLSVLRFLVMSDDLVVPVAEVGVFVLASTFDKFDDDAIRADVSRVVALVARERETHALIAQADIARVFTDALMRLGPDRYGRDLVKKALCLRLANAIFNAFFFLCDGDLFKALSKEATAADAVQLILDEFKEPEEREGDDKIWNIFYTGTPAAIIEELAKDHINISDYEWLASSPLAPNDGGPDKRFHDRIGEEVGKAEAANDAKALEKWDAVEKAWNEAVVRAELVKQVQSEGRRVVSLIQALDGIASAADVAAKALSRQRGAKREEAAVDPLADVRSALCAATGMFLWSKGTFSPSSSPVSVAVSDNLENVVWSDGSGRKLGSIPISSIQKVSMGKAPKYHGNVKKAELCFALVGSSGVLMALEVPRASLISTWLGALKTLLRSRGVAVDE